MIARFDGRRENCPPLGERELFQINTGCRKLSCLRQSFCSRITVAHGLGENTKIASENPEKP
jgi:hypothetical protein